VQQTALARLLQPFKELIAKDAEPMKALAYANFEIAHDFVGMQMVHPERVCSRIAVLGGIMVNLPGHIDDRFVPMTFEVLDCRTGEVQDLFHTLGKERTREAEYIFGSEESRRPFFQDISSNRTLCEEGNIKKASNISSKVHR